MRSEMRDMIRRRKKNSMGKRRKRRRMRRNESTWPKKDHCLLSERILRRRRVSIRD